MSALRFAVFRDLSTFLQLVIHKTTKLVSKSYVDALGEDKKKGNKLILYICERFVCFVPVRPLSSAACMAVLPVPRE